MAKIVMRGIDVAQPNLIFASGANRRESGGFSSARDRTKYERNRLFGNLCPSIPFTAEERRSGSESIEIVCCEV